jgi:NADPH:quinone reductase-like Zn-dependent oxidoreductase
VARKILFYETGPAEVPAPEPGAGEIRLRVKAIGLNRAKISFRAATYGPPPAAFPAQLGLEASGAIDAVGAGECVAASSIRAATSSGLET